jgi:ferredoxin like protein
MTVRLDLKLGTLTFRPDPEPHIVVETEVCLACAGRPCTVVCPAGLYVWEDGQLVHNCEGCLECGSCRAVCPHGAVAWRYPLGGYGVRYLWG